MSEVQTAAPAVPATRTRDVKHGGRTITVRRLLPSERMKVKRLVPAQDADKLLYLGDLMVAASVQAIDGVPVPFPQQISDVEATLDDLDDAMLAIQEAMMDMAGTTTSAETLAAAKN